ncbi:excinuclease ABC subunit UvrC [Oligoflexaceae bacterium]|nr:excinuclease ABC subunit UvrC [Oligoflexaceae bacterium]
MNPATIKSLQNKVKSLPETSGVYLMKDPEDKIIYVGKAKNLRNRVRSYFSGLKDKDPKTRKLVSRIESFDIIITKTEVEALLTERTLIRHHAPIYNVLLRDDKEFPYVRVDFNEDWPRIEKVRKRKKDQAKYLGPFGDTRQLYLMLKSIGRIFPMIRCSRHEFAAAKRPCNYYHMKMCLAPCVDKSISSDEYKEMIRNALSVLEGKTAEIRERLEELMQKASDEMRFEQAAKFRDQIAAMSRVSEKQTAVVKSIRHADILVPKLKGDVLCFYILMIRESRLVGGDHFIVQAPAQSLVDATSSFIVQYYDGHSLPDELILPEDFQELEILQELFKEWDRQNKVQLVFPQKGDKKRLIEMAEKNAIYQLKEVERSQSGMRATLELLQTKLELENLPRRIECIDISNMQGQAIVASDVCFIEGRPAKDLYRVYNIQTVEGKNDDFASILEVVSRRLKRGIEQQDLPDLLLIDGGKGQLSSALKAAEPFVGLTVDFRSIAKSRTQKQSRNVSSSQERSFERIFSPGKSEPHVLTPGSPEFRILTQIRDEAHRFAITHHRKKRKVKLFGSELDAIPGVGERTKARLLASLGDVEAIKTANLDQLRRVEGVNDKVALSVYTWFRKD